MKCTCLTKYLHIEDVISHSKIFHFKVAVKLFSVQVRDAAKQKSQSEERNYKFR